MSQKENPPFRRSLFGAPSNNSASPTGSAGYTRASSFGDSNRGREHDSVVRRLDMEFQKPGSGPLPKASSTPKMKKRPSIVSSPGVTSPASTISSKSDETMRNPRRSLNFDNINKSRALDDSILTERMETSETYDSDAEISPLCQALLLSPSPGVKNPVKRKLGDRTPVQFSFYESPRTCDLAHSPGSLRSRNKPVSSGEKVETKRTKLSQTPWLVDRPPLRSLQIGQSIAKQQQIIQAPPSPMDHSPAFSAHPGDEQASFNDENGDVEDFKISQAPCSSLRHPQRVNTPVDSGVWSSSVENEASTLDKGLGRKKRPVARALFASPAGSSVPVSSTDENVMEVTSDDDCGSPEFKFKRGKPNRNRPSTDSPDESAGVGTCSARVSSPLAPRLFRSKSFNHSRAQRASDVDEQCKADDEDGDVAMIRRSVSDSHAMINRALQRVDAHPDLIADCSRPYCLPFVTDGVKHPDLKHISPQTLAQVLEGQFSGVLSSYRVIDCRFPYEFAGGHITGAVNIYTKDQLLKDILPSEPCPPIVHTWNDNGDFGSPERNVLIFHCEFSSERGPSLARFLRNKDRVLNCDNYPALHFPEIYVLEGGYKAFFEANPNMCTPSGYTLMIDPNYSAQMKQFRAEAKSSYGDTGSTVRIKRHKSRF